MRVDWPLGFPSSWPRSLEREGWAKLVTVVPHPFCGKVARSLAFAQDDETAVDLVLAMFEVQSPVETTMSGLMLLVRGTDDRCKHCPATGMRSEFAFVPARATDHTV